MRKKMYCHYLANKIKIIHIFLYSDNIIKRIEQHLATIDIVSRKWQMMPALNININIVKLFTYLQLYNLRTLVLYNQRISKYLKVKLESGFQMLCKNDATCNFACFDGWFVCYSW